MARRIRSEKEKAANRERMRKRDAQLKLDPEYRASENQRLSKYVKARRSDPEKLAHDRKMNAEREKKKRNTDPAYKDKCLAQNKDWNNRKRLDRELDAFFADIKETQGI